MTRPSVVKENPMFSQAQELYQAGEYEQAQRILLSMVENGDTDFQSLKLLVRCHIRV